MTSPFFAIVFSYLYGNFWLTWSFFNQLFQGGEKYFLIGQLTPFMFHKQITEGWDWKCSEPWRSIQTFMKAFFTFKSHTFFIVHAKYNFIYAQRKSWPSMRRFSTYICENIVHRISSNPEKAWKIRENFHLLSYLLYILLSLHQKVITALHGVPFIPNYFWISPEMWEMVKVILEQATKAQRGSRYIALLFLQPRR